MSERMMILMKKIAILWSRFGHYHIARLRSASLFHAKKGIAVVGLEVSSRDSIYQWDLVNDHNGFERRVVFPGANYADLTARQISSGIARALGAIQPCAVAINGWSVPEAVAALRWCRREGCVAILMSESKEDEAIRRWWKERIKSWRVQRFDAALTGGAPHRDYICNLGMPRERVFLGYDAIDNDYFAKGTQQVRKDSIRLRNQNGLPEKYFYCNTRFLPRKNIDGLLRAYAMYRERVGGSSWGLVITGNGETERTSKQLAQSLGLSDIVWP
jgi:glycosyltransferase involved in cell wall biosynthesis